MYTDIIEIFFLHSLKLLDRFKKVSISNIGHILYFLISHSRNREHQLVIIKSTKVTTCNKKISTLISYFEIKIPY